MYEFSCASTWQSCLHKQMIRASEKKKKDYLAYSDLLMKKKLMRRCATPVWAMISAWLPLQELSGSTTDVYSRESDYVSV